MRKKWENFNHKADIGVRGIGSTMAEAFEQAAIAMTAVITDPKKVRPDNAIAVECEAVDEEILLADWLNTIIYEMATRQMLFGRFDVHIDRPKLKATLHGEKINQQRHSPIVEVKAATYNQLKVEQNSDGSWTAQCVVDV